MGPVGTQSIWKSSTRLADGREIVYFDESPGLGRELVPDTRDLPPRPPGPPLPARSGGSGDRRGPAGRRRGGERGGPPGPHLPAAARSVPARPVGTGAAHRDPGAQPLRG